jgi:hypothetical protein
MEVKKKTREIVIGAILAGAAMGAIAEPRSPFSNFDESYKCSADEQGGYNHSRDGAELTRFKEPIELFLTHVRDIPIEAIRGYDNQLKNEDEESARLLFESALVTTSEQFGVVQEANSYFIREPNENPRESFQLRAKGCSTLYWNDTHTKSVYRSIMCYGSARDGANANHTNKLFELNLETGKFSYAYLGSWHGKVENDYYGDSSIFAFGTCKPYYP